MIDLSRSPRVVFRLVAGATLIALLWKVMYFVVFGQVYFAYPLTQRFFPVFFESPLVVAVAYGGAVLSLVCLLIVRRTAVMRTLCVVAFAAVSVLCLHQGSHNDATFTAAWWTVLWLSWFSGRVDEGAVALKRAARLSRVIVSVILLGGAVGKWTGEYWSGQVLYEIYFVDRDYWAFNVLRESYGPESLRVVATWYSRSVILVESLCGLGLWMLSPRIAAAIGVVVLTAIAVLSNFLLLSVTLSLTGLSAVGFWCPTGAVTRRLHAS